MTLTQQFVVGGYMFVVPVFVQMVLGYDAMKSGLTVLPASLCLFGAALGAARLVARVGPRRVVQVGLVLAFVGLVFIIGRLEVAVEGRDLAIGLMFMGTGLGLIVSQLNNLTLSAVQPDETAEAAGMNSAIQNLGVALGTAVGGTVLLVALTAGFSAAVDDSTVLTSAQQQEAQAALDRGVSVVSNDVLTRDLRGQPPEVVDEAVRINTEVRPRAMQIALLLPVVALLVGMWWSRRLREPDLAAAPD